jgi:thiamine-phosphate pyrophosphorylase
MRLDLYVVTDAGLSCGLGHVEVARRALRGGANVIQLRDKEMSGGDLYRAAVEIRELTSSSGALFIVNDRLDIAMASEADGVHLGQRDLPIAAVRMLVPPWFIVGASATTLEEGLRAARDGAHYVGLGPIFPTGTKADAAPPCGLGALRKLRSQVSTPIVAIGGINDDNVREVIEAGADGVAVVSAVVGQQDISSAVRALCAKIAAAKGRGPHAVAADVTGTLSNK